MVFGYAGAYAVGMLLSDVLFQISAADPVTYAAVTAVVVVMTLLACYIPARRAMRVDPIIALRHLS
jgi:putative ABC transport system permease protein